MNIDSRISDLVDSLNEFEGIETFSSCGGHINPSAGQDPLYEFYVEFNLDDTVEAWRSLEKIVILMQLSDDWEDLAITLWVDDGGLHFNLKGLNEAEPNVLAVVLRDCSRLLPVRIFL